MITIRTTTIVILLAFFGTGFSQKNYQCKEFKKHDPELSIAAYSKDMLYDKSTGIMYRITNNDSALAVDIAVSDGIKQRKIMMFGSKIWIDIQGKRKKRRGVMFPMGRKEFDDMRPPGNTDQGNQKNGREDNFDREKHKMASRIKNIEIIGIYDELNGVFNTWTEAQIFAAAEFDDIGMLYYRLEIPFEKLGLDYELIKYAEISIGFETGYLDVSQMHGRPGGMKSGNGPPRGGSGTRPGGGPPGGENSDRMQMMQKMSQPDKFWIKGVKLF